MYRPVQSGIFLQYDSYSRMIYFKDITLIEKKNYDLNIVIKTKDKNSILLSFKDHKERNDLYKMLVEKWLEYCNTGTIEAKLDRLFEMLEFAPVIGTQYKEAKQRFEENRI